MRNLDGDGWLRYLFLANGHVYPEVDRLKTEAGSDEQRKVVYRNLRNGRFADVTEQLGPPVTIPKAGRGAAFADFDNDGDVAAQMMLRLELEPLAEAELKQALAKDPKTPRANYLLGQLALFRGRLEESIALTSSELALNPSDAMALSQLGDAYTRASRTDDAIAALQKSMWLNPSCSTPCASSSAASI